MGREGGGGFARILAEAQGGEALKPESKKEVNAVMEQAAAPDSLRLSIQGKKALSAQVPCVRSPCHVEEERNKLEDWQGNRIHLTPSARKLAEDMEDRVAWETRLKNKKRQAPGS